MTTVWLALRADVRRKWPALLSLALAPYATGLSLLLLTAQFGYLSVRFNRAGRGACADPPRITARKDHIA